MNDGYFMQLVIDESRKCIYRNESPFAAGIFADNEFIISGNSTRTSNNPNLHAEIMCINEFCKKKDYHYLKNATLYSSCEPCLMCLHYIANAGIKRIVFGATIDDAIRFKSGDVSFRVLDYSNKMDMDITVIEKVFQEKAVMVFEECINFRGEL